MSLWKHILVVVAAAFLSGCGGSQMSENQIASSEQNVAAAVAAFTAGDATKAEQTATQAIDGGGLPVDLFVQALLVRAASRGVLGSHDSALTDLDQAAQGAGEMDKVHALRSLILTAKGDATGAAQELTKAKQLNKSLKLPADLKSWDFAR